MAVRQKRAGKHVREEVSRTFSTLLTRSGMKVSGIVSAMPTRSVSPQEGCTGEPSHATFSAELATFDKTSRMFDVTEAEKLELEIMNKTQQLAALRRDDDDIVVADYTFQTLDGEIGLSGLLADRERLLVIHNMGQGCRYCTLWADGINGVLEHLEDAMAVVLVSKDPPEIQRRMALDRGWKFRMASHGGGRYMAEQCAMGEHANCPGAAVYQCKDGRIVRRGRTAFGPGDLYSPVWHFLSLAGLSVSDWTPQFHYWCRPERLDDGGENVRG